MRISYWSCSKFSRWLTGNTKPQYATASEWDKWEQSTAIARPFRYWIAETALDEIQDFIYFIPKKLDDIRHYIINRYINKLHCLTSTSLTKGQYYDFEHRMLHCLFDELVNFIAIEKGTMNKISNPAPYKSDIDHGLEYLQWETTIRNTWLDENDPDYNKPTLQAEVAMWIINAYNWWTNIRPNRPDPMDVSGWSDYCDKNPEGVSISNDDTKEMNAILDKMEREYYEEDTQMLIQLIKYRTSLWT